MNLPKFRAALNLFLVILGQSIKVEKKALRPKAGLDLPSHDHSEYLSSVCVGDWQEQFQKFYQKKNHFGS